MPSRCACICMCSRSDDYKLRLANYKLIKRAPTCTLTFSSSTSSNHLPVGHISGLGLLCTMEHRSMRCIHCVSVCLSLSVSACLCLSLYVSLCPSMTKPTYSLVQASCTALSTSCALPQMALCVKDVLTVGAHVQVYSASGNLEFESTLRQAQDREVYFLAILTI